MVKEKKNPAKGKRKKKNFSRCNKAVKSKAHGSWILVTELGLLLLEPGRHSSIGNIVVTVLDLLVS